MKKLFKINLNIILSITLLIGISFSIIKIVKAVAPNPGHSFMEVGDGTAGSIPFFGGTNLTEDNSNFFWETTNKNLGIGTNTPTEKLHVFEDSNNVIVAKVDNPNTGNGAVAEFDANSDVANTVLGSSSSAFNLFPGFDTSGFLYSNQKLWILSDDSIRFITGGVSIANERMRINSAGNIGIGTSAPGQALEVNGGVMLNTATSKPICGSASRGTFWSTQGATGVKDDVEVCAKDAADAYAWRTIY